MSQKYPLLKIESLQPSKRSFSLQFQILQILTKKQNQSFIRCFIIDNTGYVEAEFNDFFEQLKLNQVYLMRGLTVVLEENHLKVKMLGKQTKIEILPEGKAFRVKNRKVNMSEKYYVSKKQYEEVLKKQKQQEKKQVGKKNDKKKQNQKSKKEQNSQQVVNLTKKNTKNHEKNQKNNKDVHDDHQKYKQKPQNSNSNQKPFVAHRPHKNSYQQKPKFSSKQQSQYQAHDNPLKPNLNKTQSYNNNNNNNKSSKYGQDDRRHDNYKNNRDEKYERYDNYTNQKYIQKYMDKKYSQSQAQNNNHYRQKYFKHHNNAQQSKYKNQQQHTTNDPQKIIKLSQTPNFINQKISILVWVDSRKRVYPLLDNDDQKQDWKCYIIDSSGGMWMSFAYYTQIQGNQWYLMDNVKVIEEQEGKFLLYESKRTSFKVYQGKQKMLANKQMLKFAYKK